MRLEISLGKRISYCDLYCFYFQSLCEDVGPNASQLDFSVFETDIVQIAAFDNEGYYRLGDKYGKDNEIIEAVEVREVGGTFE